jgi:hypothetical protein
MMKILLTGGAGYVGSACLPWLLSHGHDPIADDNLSDGNGAAVPDAPNWLIFGDITETDRLAEVLGQRSVEAVTYFDNHAALDNPESRSILLELAGRAVVEIRMHTHPCNSPPLVRGWWESVHLIAGGRVVGFCSDQRGIRDLGRLGRVPTSDHERDRPSSLEMALAI